MIHKSRLIQQAKFVSGKAVEILAAIADDQWLVAKERALSLAEDLALLNRLIKEVV